MANQILLSDSNYCRLCAENNTNGTNLFNVDENKQKLSELVNTYLPLKVVKESRYPKTICPGCNIQLEATKSFFDLIISGQFKLKDLLAEQTAILQRQENQKQQLEHILKSVNPSSSVESYAIQTDDSGDTFFIKILTDGPLFPQDHELALKISASVADKPKKKRGRPAKVHKPEEEVACVETPKDFNKEEVDAENQKNEQEEATTDAEGRGKRKIKVPSRFNEVLKGEELEQAFKKEGVLDEDNQADYYITNSKVADIYDSEVIGHLQDENGEQIEQLILNKINTNKAQIKYNVNDKMSVRFECEYCGRVFHHSGRFEIHKAFHKNLRYQCDNGECKLQFENKVSLDLHQRKEEHAGVTLVETVEKFGDVHLPPYKGEEFSTDSKETKYACEYCDKVFNQLDKYDVHKLSHKFITYRCEQKNCNIEFDTKKLMDLHQVKECHSSIAIVEKSDVEDQNPEYDNSDTEDDPDYRSDLLEIKKDTSIMPSQEQKTFPCGICHKTFSCKQNFDVHVRAVHLQEKPFHCVPCNKTFPYRNTFRAHMLQHADRKYNCDVCQKQFHHPSSLVYHKEAEHNNGRRYICKKCGKAFKHKQLLMRHQLVHSDSRPFTCKLCGSAFKTRPNLAHHIATHSGERKYACAVPQCAQTFAHKTSLTMHQRWHDGQKPYECDVCGKTFSQKGNLAEHRRIHTGEKPYCCSLCQRKFTTSSQYKLHIKRHTGERPWRCEYCGKTFLHKDTWKCHTRRHRNERPYQCKQCMRGFTEHWALKKHMRLHSGERPHACDQCDKAFADSSNLTKHRRIHAKNAAAAAAVVGKPVIESVTSLATAAGDHNVVAGQLMGSGSSALSSPAVGFNIIKNDTISDQLLYLTYGDESNNSMPQTLVHIVDDIKSDDSDDVMTNDVDFDVNDTLRHLVDEDGVPITVTTTEGHHIKVVTTTINDEPMIQGLMSDGTLVAINLTMHDGKSFTADIVAPVPLMPPTLDTISERRKRRTKVVDILGNVSFLPSPQHIASPLLSCLGDSPTTTVEEKVALLHQGIDPSATPISILPTQVDHHHAALTNSSCVQQQQQHQHLQQFLNGKSNSSVKGVNNIEFVTEDGQNVCFVYDIESSLPLVNEEYLK